MTVARRRTVYVYALSSLDTEEPLRTHTEALRLPKSGPPARRHFCAARGAGSCVVDEAAEQKVARRNVDAAA